MKYNKIIASKIAPNPKEAQYWVDLAADKHGKIIKVFTASGWSPITMLQTEGGVVMSN